MTMLSCIMHFIIFSLVYFPLSALVFVALYQQKLLKPQIHV